LVHTYKSKINFAHLSFIAEFPDDCNFFKGPNSLNCYENIWVRSGCLVEGLANPRNQTRHNAATFHALNL